MKVIQSFGKDARSAPLRLTLCDINADMTDAWLNSFFGVPAVEIVQGDLMDAGADAVVSPANSFGDMSGGVDKRIDDYCVEHYKGSAQESIIRHIRERFVGELPVGMALVVPLKVNMSGARPPYVVAAPTMRVPERVADTLNAYLALRAALVSVTRFNAGFQNSRRADTYPDTEQYHTLRDDTAQGKANNALIRALAVPGLCTGVGGMAPGVAAHQMRAAYDNIIGEGWKAVEHPAMAPFAFSGKNIRWQDKT